MRDLPRSVYLKNGSYWHVKAEGKRRVWTKLSRAKEGLPAMYRALADLQERDVVDDRMPALVHMWLQEVSTRRSAKTQANDQYQARNIARSFAEFRANQITPPDVVEFLRHFRDKPRSHNAHRALLRELMRFAEEKGLREPGTNPVQSIKTASEKARSRYITDSEFRRIKVALLRSSGQRSRQINPAGRIVCNIMDMAYLTGQRISDVLALEWSALTQDGIMFQPSKTAGSTGAKVLIEWTPRLREVVASIRASRRVGIVYVFPGLDGQPYRYDALKSAWRRALKRAGIEDAHIHDLRAKALTDVDRRHGVTAAQRMGAHSTQQQTADYVRHKTAIRAKATR